MKFFIDLVSPRPFLNLPPPSQPMLGSMRRCMVFQPLSMKVVLKFHFYRFGSINSSPSSIRQDLYANIILSGGTTMFRGLGSRLSKEILRIAPPGTKVS